MNYVKSHSVSTSFNSMLNYATTAAVVTEHMKNDFQNAIRRNLHNWAKWRTELNDRLVQAVMSGTHNQLRSAADVEPIGQYLMRDAPDPDHPTTNPRTLLSFSATANSSTPLPSDEFYKFGIPRARIDPQKLNSSSIAVASSDVVMEAEDARAMLAATAAIVNGCSGDEMRSPHQLRTDKWQSASAAISPHAAASASSKLISLSDDVSKCNSALVDDHNEDDDDDDLVFDYFNYADDKAASSCQQQSHGSFDLLTTRRFHRSAATLPAVPSSSDDVISCGNHAVAGSNQASSPLSAAAKKIERRRKVYLQPKPLQQQHPLDTKPSRHSGQIAAGIGAIFGRPFARQRIVTTRRDDKLYGHKSAWHLDELRSWSSGV